MTEKKRERYTKGALLLLVALVTQLGVYPYIDGASVVRSPWLLTTTNSVLLSVVVYSIGTTTVQRFGAVVIALPTVVLCWIHHESLKWVVLGLSILLYFYAICLMIPRLFKAKKIGIAEVYTVAATYILIGIAWSNIYQAIDWLQPMSYRIEGEGLASAPLPWSKHLFFSFTTLTTLGYGDITPASLPAQSMAILESVTGLIFIAVIIARTIALYVFQAGRET